jgi:hypothetical protein
MSLPGRSYTQRKSSSSSSNFIDSRPKSVCKSMGWRVPCEETGVRLRGSGRTPGRKRAGCYEETGGREFRHLAPSFCWEARRQPGIRGNGAFCCEETGVLELRA